MYIYNDNNKKIIIYDNNKIKLASLNINIFMDLFGNINLQTIINKRINKMLKLTRIKNKLLIMDEFFIELEHYRYYGNNIRYRCVNLKNNEAILRPIVKKGKRDLIYTTSIDNWMLNK